MRPQWRRISSNRSTERRMEQTGEENGTNGGKRVQKKELLRGGNCVCGCRFYFVIPPVVTLCTYGRGSTHTREFHTLHILHDLKDKSYVLNTRSAFFCC